MANRYACFMDALSQDIKILKNQKGLRMQCCKR